MKLIAGEINFKYTDNNRELIEQLSTSNDPKISIEVRQDITIKNPPSYKELFEQMEDYKIRLKQIRDYEPYSLNNYSDFIDSRTADID